MIRVFEVSADRQPARQACDLHARRPQLLLQIERSRIDRAVISIIVSTLLALGKTPLR